MPEADIHGDFGAISDASWTARWMSWSQPAQDKYMASVTSWGPLYLEQMEHLIQGLLPPTHAWLCPPTALAEFRPLIVRLRQDIDRGVLPKAPTPSEFAAWCDQMSVELPLPFVQALQVAAKVPKTLLAPQSPVTVKLEPWVFALVSDEPAIQNQSRPKRGRPPVSAPTNKVLCDEGTRVLIDAARQGVVLTIPKVAHILSSLPCGQGKQLANIERRLKGKLPLDSAKETATKHQVAGSQKRRKSLF